MLRKWTFLFVIYTLPAFGLENDIRWLQDKKIDDFKLRLRKKFDEVTSLKRAMEQDNKLSPSVSTHLVESGSTESVARGSGVWVDGSDVVFAVTGQNVLSVLRNVTLVPISKVPTYRPFLSLQAVADGRAVKLVAQHSGKKFRHFVTVYGYELSKVTRHQKIPLDGLSSVSAAQYGHRIYVAVVPRNAVFPKFTLYQWTGVQFDDISHVQLNASCSGLATWSMEGTVYVALSFVDSGRMQIMRWMEYTQMMSSVQVLDVHAHVVKAFEEADSRYLICGTRKSVILYWWTGNRFQAMHSKLFGDTILDVAAYSLYDHIIIAVVFEHRVEFLAQDSSARYVTAGNLSFVPPEILKSVLLWKSGTNLFMMPLFKGKRPMSIYEIDHFYTSEANKDGSLESCVDTLEDHLVKREMKLEGSANETKKAWRLSAISKIPNLTVKGSVRSPRNVTVRSLPLDTNVPSLEAVRRLNEDWLVSTMALRASLSNSALKSVAQSIQSDLHFTKLTVDRGNVKKLANHVNINEVWSNRLPHALKKKGRQTFLRQATLSTAAVDGSVTTNLLNGKQIEEYVLLKDGACNMTGHFTFGNVSAGNVATPTVNGVRLTDIVVSSKEQEIRGRKVFKGLTAIGVRTTDKNTNKILLDDVKELVYLDSKYFRTPLTFVPELNIQGNLTVSLLNGYGISRLHSNTVKKNEDMDISGAKVFHSVIINGRMEVLGNINGLPLPNLMTVNTNQDVRGAVTFSNATYLGDVLTDSLNGVHLPSEAVRKWSDFEIDIRGVKKFGKNLTVSDILLGEGVEIDSFDPSLETLDIVFKVQNRGAHSDVTTQSHQRFTGNVTMGNIMAENMEVGREHFPFLEQLDNVWLKTIEQNVSRLDAKNMTVKELQVSRVNDVTMEDFVTVTGNSGISATVLFDEEVSTGTLNLRRGATVNYSAEFWNPDVKVKIFGNVTLKDPEINGNLSVTGMAGNFVKDFMHVQRRQDVIGKVKFGEIRLKELNSTALNFDLLNKVNVTDYYERSMLLSKDLYVFNKTFTKLNGTAMECYGCTLNNVSFDRVATTDTPQVLKSSYQFLTSTHFKKGIEVKKFSSGIRLENVVYADFKNGTISNKYFKGNTTTPRLKTVGDINGVNVTQLKQEAFSRSAANVVKAAISFRGDVTASEIQVFENKTIDNVKLEDLVRLNESFTLDYLNASSLKAENVTVYGLINGCNLTSVLDHALWLKGDTQNLTSKMHINDLAINGSLSVGFLNGASLQAWIVLLNATSTSDVYSEVIFEHLRVDGIDASDKVNDISMKFLLQDYVGKRGFQNIRGLKHFRDIRVGNMTADLVTTNKTCRTDLSEIYKIFINRSSESVTNVYSDLKLGALETKKLTVAGGRLNELKFPDDVILINTSETIDSPVIFNGSVNASAGLNATGKIDGVRLEIFIEERVTLAGEAEILSGRWIFENDTHITVNTSINGTINKLLLDDIVKVSGNQTVYGTKNFSEELSIESEATVLGPVNQLLLNHLDKNICRVSRNETLNGVVHFSSLGASPSLTIDTMNGLSVGGFYNFSHRFVHLVEDRLADFTLDIQTHQELLRSRRDSVEHPLSLFSSFDLLTFLSFDSTRFSNFSVERFLPVYEYGAYGPKYDLQVTQMIIWVRDPKDPCGRRKSLIADVTHHGTFDVTAEKRGRLFPFTLTVDREGVVGFYVQADYSKSCSEVKTRVLAIESSGHTKRRTIELPDNATLLDVRLLELQEVFLILSYSDAGSSEWIQVYRYNATTNRWSSHQKFHDQGVTSVDVISVERVDESLYEPPSVYLSVTGAERNPGVTVYEWDFDQFVLKTNISTSASSLSLWVDSDRSLYLLLAKRLNGTSPFSEPVEVYTLGEELALNHTVNARGVTSMEVFALAEETFVLATSTHAGGTVYVLQFRGYNGFELIQALPSHGATETRLFTVEGHLYLALNSSPCKILKATIRGGRQGFV